jgi:hypothetical protein
VGRVEERRSGDLTFEAGAPANAVVVPLGTPHPGGKSFDLDMKGSRRPAFACGQMLIQKQQVQVDPLLAKVCLPSRFRHYSDRMFAALMSS